MCIQKLIYFRRTALHVASEVGNASAVLALIQNGADFDALDVEHDNGLHIAVREGHLTVVKTLLTESSINAEAVNLKVSKGKMLLFW